ncbi:coiled-coil domain-containing protein 186-like [Battus philenor]|uniref:coiled-coil domain-containing protein 186-like n=1 Tax=Battus philenor TaxID=42288 RepID=UPI0035CE96A7
MSKELDINSVDTKNVDVDDLEKECTANNDRNNDSGVDSAELSSATVTATSDSEISPLKSADTSIFTHETSQNETTSGNESSNTPASLSPSEPSEDINDDLSLPNEPASEEFAPTKNDFNIDVDSNKYLTDVSHTPSNLVNKENLDSDVISKYIQTDLENISIRNLTTSTVSLNEPASSLDNSIICKSPYSRSAENISNLEETQNGTLNSSSKSLNPDEILSQFTNQKPKVNAVQRIPEQINDIKQSRLPKEILSQDLGSIVKNVHGIFWSVSGNLKNAYTQRVSAQKPQVKNLKPILNGKVMNDIFEDTVDVPITTPCQNQSSPVDEVKQINSEKKQDNINGEIDNDMKNDALKLQIESLERMLSEQRRENVVLRERVKQQVDELTVKDQTFKELEAKLDSMCKKVEQAQKDANAAVMRYAGAECAAIEGRKAADAAKRAHQAAVNECELLTGKLKSAHSEKQRICQLYDDKCHELQNSERETAKLREDLKELEGRLKWTQSKLRMEMDAYKESSEKVEKLTQQVTDLEAAKEAATAGASDSARAKVLEVELKESQAALILSRHECGELDKRLTAVTQQLEACKKEREEASAALSSAQDEVERLKAHNLRLEEEAAELAALRAQAALADTLSTQLQRETERAAQAEEALSGERARAETCARREAAALEHAARVTAQHVTQRARAADNEAKAQALSADNVSLRERASALEAEAESLRTALTEESERRQRENRVLARKVAELTEELAEVSKRLEWEKGENSVLKKKHSSTIKELNRELQRALKRSEQLEAKLQRNDSTSTRTGSVTSLSSGEGLHADERAGGTQNGLPDAVPDVQAREPERQVLIERIVSLQRAAARRAERCEFLEEHARQLTAELRGKSRLLRQLLAAQPAGAVAPARSDANKKEIAKLGGGAMAALWGGDPAGMTLELSLEMNKRLQALLEDTLLKNITLKENMDTLGEEIARLKADKNQTADRK